MHPFALGICDEFDPAKLDAVAEPLPSGAMQMWKAVLQFRSKAGV